MDKKIKVPDDITKYCPENLSADGIKLMIMDVL